MSYFYTSLFENALDTLLEFLDTTKKRPTSSLFSIDYFISSLSLPETSIRQAVNELVNRGQLLYCGNNHYCIAPDKLKRDMLKMSSLSDAMSAKHIQLHSKVLSFEVCEATKDAALALNLPLGSEVIKLHRLRSTESTPSIIETSYLPAKTYSKLLKYDFSKASLYTILRQEYGIQPITQAIQFIAELPTADDKKYFNITSAEPIMVHLGKTSDTNGHVFEYSIARTLGRYFEFISSPHLGDV